MLCHQRFYFALLQGVTNANYKFETTTFIELVVVMIFFLKGEIYE